ncbi:MAG: ParB/RepB/Spo0J family partition protein [Bacteroidales bacterium]|nr:ParB/RepB/Spo0J family partition protein [Bacteroidales bacterium]MBQ7818768.1 ParB/RepB/Spo0J family partition protein [Bacteroidales bacterium]
MLKRNALGRGLDALIAMEEIKTSGSSSINEIDINLIKPNPGQPRTDFDEEALSELATSIKELGIIQPVSLRKMDDGSYQIIAGERRYRAAKLAGLKSMPAYVRTAEDEAVMEMALIENIQREDLNAVEIALSFQKLIEQYSLTQEKLSERIGKKRTTIANYLRLLKLPAEIQLGLKNKIIDMGHARALLAIEDTALQLKIYEQIKLNGYSVRKVEELAKEVANGDNINKKGSKKEDVQLYDDFKKELTYKLKSKVKITCDNNGKGKITIPFKDDREFERIKEILNKL